MTDNVLIDYVWGDATRPQGEGKKIIVHCCNDIGGWGAGFVVALSKRWPEPEATYRAMGPTERVLGTARLVQVEDDTWVANLIGQDGVRRLGYPRPVRYDAIHDGLDVVAISAKLIGASVHMPRMGSGLAGGDWRIIEAIVGVTLSDAGIHTTVYDLPTDKH